MMAALLSMIPTFDSAAPLLIDAAVKGLAVATVALIVALTLRKQAAAWRHLVWSLTAAGLVVLPVLSMCLPAWQIPVPAEWLAALPETAIGDIVSPGATPAAEASAEFGARSPGGLRRSATLEAGVEGADVGFSASTEPPREVLVPAMSQPGEPFISKAVPVGVVPVKPLSRPETATGMAEHSESSLASPAEISKTDPLSFLRMLSWGWLVGVGVAGLVPLIGLWQVFRLRRGATVVKDDSWLALLKDVSRELRIRRRVRILKSSRTKMPLTWGALRPVVLIPDEADGWSESRRRMVLLHELAHVKRFDWLTQMVGQVASCLHWFNPMVLFVARRMQVEREQACDDMVLAAGTAATEYASELLHFATRLRTGSLSALAAVPMARQTSLEQRVRGILDGSRRRASVTRIAMITGLAVCCGFLVPLAMLQASAQDEPSSAVSDQTEAEAVRSEPASEAKEPPAETAGSPDERPVEKEKTKPEPREKPGDQSKDKAVSLDPSHKWKLTGGVTAEMTADVFHGADVMTKVILHWPAKGKRPALRYEIHVAADAFGNRDFWSVVWERGTTRLWVANSGLGLRYPNLRTIDFRDPNRIYTWTHYGSKEFKTTEPETPTVNARRQGVSIGEPPPGVPEPVMQKLAVKLPGVRKLKKEGGHYSGNHIDAASVKAEWVVTGTVRDLQKRPMKGVLVEVYTEFHPTTRIVATRTGKDGKYTLKFRMDLRTLNEWRGLMVAPRIAGFVDDDFARSGELTMLLREGEEIQNRFSEKDAIVGKPITADFLMQPAVTVTGQILDIKGKPWANSYLGLKYEGQRRGYSVVSSGTDKDGNFRMTNVPTGKPLQLITSRPNRDETILIGTAEAKPTSGVQNWKFTRGDDGWAFVGQVFDVPARVRVVEGQDEIDPPKKTAEFAQKVIDWAESCRVNRSAEVLDFNPDVWSDVLGGHSLVHVTLSPPREVNLVDVDNDRDGTLPIDEIAFALPVLGPGGLFLKSGERVLCLNHWTIEGFRPVITEPALRATQHKWYRRLIDATGGVDTKTEKTATVQVDDKGKLKFDGKPVPFRQLTKTLGAAGFGAKSTTVILKTDPGVRVKELHWPLWQLGSSGWKYVFIDFSVAATPKVGNIKGDVPDPADAPIPDSTTIGEIRGFNLVDYPSTTDYESIPELYEPDPNRPGEKRFSSRVFILALRAAPNQVSLRYAPHHKVFFIEVAEPNRQFRHYGPIPGDPFEKLKLMDLLREMSPTNRVLRIFSMIRSDDDKLRSRAFELIPELPQKRFRRTYEGLDDLVRTALKQFPNASSNEAGMTALKWLVEQDEAWHARRIEVPDGDYSPGEASIDDPKIVWSEPNEVGLRLGYSQAPKSQTWLYGDVFEMDLWIDNVGTESVRFMLTPRPDEVLGLTMTTAEGVVNSANANRYSAPPIGIRYQLKPRQRLKAMAAKFMVEKKDEPAEYRGARGMTQWFQLKTGKYTFRMHVDVPGTERLGKNNSVAVPAAGEWIGTLTSKPIAVTVGEAPPDKRDSPPGKKLELEIPEVTSMSGNMHSAFAVQTKDAVNFVLYSEDQLKSEISWRQANGVVTFRGPIHLVRKGKRIRTFKISYSSERPDELLINEERHVLNHVIAKTEKGALQLAGRLFVLVEDLAPLNTQRTLQLRSKKDFETIHRMAYRDLSLARHYRHNRKLDAMTGWILSWNDQHMIQHSDGAHVAQMRIFPDGRVIVAERRRGLLTLKLSKAELNKLLSELIEHPAAQRIPKLAPPTARPDDKGAIPIQLSMIRGGHWDQASSRVLIKDDGETWSLFWLSKSRDGRPQTGMTDEQWAPISKRLWELALRVQKETANPEPDEPEAE